MLSKILKLVGIDNTNSKDYDSYQLSVIDVLIGYAIGFALSFFITIIFFENKLFSTFISIIAGFVAIKPYRTHLISKRKEKLLLQFKDFLESLSTSYLSGRNTIGAFKDSYDDMVLLYGKDSYIAIEIDTINRGIENGFNIEQMLTELGDRSHIDDIISFANIFVTCNRTGGNINTIIYQTREIISDKIEIQLEIKTNIAQKKSEFYIMCCMPFIILLSLKLMGDSTFSPSNITNLIIRILALAMLSVSYFLGKKITNIKI